MVSVSWRNVLLFGCVLVVRLQAKSLTSLNDNTTAAVTNYELAIERHVHGLPKIEVVKTVERSRTQFTGTFHREYEMVSQKDTQMSLEDEAEYYSWEIAWPGTGKRIEQFVRLRPAEKLEVKKAVEPSGVNQNEDRRQRQWEEKNDASPVTGHPKHRTRRVIYGTDTRRYLTRRLYMIFPYSGVVRISTGCTGTLVSPRHVLTSAHCIHDQKDYVAGYHNLKTGILLRNGRFAWIAVNDTYLPRGWLSGDPNVASKYDYCLLKLQRRHHRRYFTLGISENTKNAVGKRVHFTAFADDKPKNTLWYRSCIIRDKDEHVLYYYCDAVPGSSGAGVYLWDYDYDDRRWERKLIGVFSGNRWKSVKFWSGSRQVNYNAAIRINSVTYTQLCGWMGSDAIRDCKQKYYTT